MDSEPSPKIIADLRTAQNRMFQFVETTMQSHRTAGTIESLLKDQEKPLQLYQSVEQQLFSMLNIDHDKRVNWHMGIADSGKRAIETLVSFFCPEEPKANIAVNTENYVAYNKFSAVNALKQQKGVEFVTPFDLTMGQALTIGSPEEMARAQQLLRQESTKTLWIAWNSTSTGIVEEVEKLVAFRNECNSDALIISDAASLPLFSRSWKSIEPRHLPDAFFFSLRKQGLPYDGPQDEANQAKNSGALYVFNDRALKSAKSIDGPCLYECPRPENTAEYSITKGPQRENHLKHLLKLQCCLQNFLDENDEKLQQQDLIRKKIKENIVVAFGGDSPLTTQGFKLVADSKAQSETAYIVSVPETAKPKELIAELKEAGVQVSLSMHPKLAGTSYFRFACYPATSLDEAQIALNSIRECFGKIEASHH